MALPAPVSLLGEDAGWIVRHGEDVRVRVCGSSGICYDYSMILEVGRVNVDI